jgi:hypothetical protein
VQESQAQTVMTTYTVVSTLSPPLNSSSLNHVHESDSMPRPQPPPMPSSFSIDSIASANVIAPSASTTSLDLPLADFESHKAAVWFRPDLTRISASARTGGVRDARDCVLCAQLNISPTNRLAVSLLD